MRKSTIFDAVVVMTAVLFFAGNAGAVSTPIPDGGATSVLFLAALAGVGAVRKFMR